MREGWEQVALGELTTKRVDFTPVVASTEYPVVGVQRSGWGLLARDAVRGDSMKFSKLMRLNANDLVYRMITAFEAPSAVVDASFDGTYVTPQTFPVFRIDSSRLLPGFMRLLTTSPVFHEAMSERCTGTVLRRKTISVGAFQSIPIDLPPLAEQQRIVDLIGSLDETIEAAVSNQNTLAAFGQARLSKAFSEADMAPVSDFADLIVGFAFKSASYADRGVRLLRGDNIVPGATRWDDAKRITPTDSVVQAKKYSLNVGDVVLAMDRPVISSGVKSARISSEDLPSQLVQRVARLRPKSREFARSIELCFSSREFESYLSSGQVGAHVPHINAQQINTFEVPTSMFLEDVAESFSATSDSATAASSYVSTLRHLRTNLLTALLSGAHEIPESYDDQLSEAA